MLSPSELESKIVPARGRKYYKLEMDEYLELVFDNYKSLYAENEELKKQVKTLSDGIQYYRSIESTMQKALVLAEKTSKETKDAAVLKAESIEKDARNKANRIVSEAEAEYDRIRDKCLNLVQQFNRYKQQLQSAAHEQLRLVTSASFEVDTPDIEGRDVAAAIATPLEAGDMPGVSEVGAPEYTESYEQQPVEGYMQQPVDPYNMTGAPEPDTQPIPVAPERPDTQPQPIPVVSEQPDMQPSPVIEQESAITPEWTMDESVSDPVPVHEPVPEKTTILPDVKSVDREALRSREPMTAEQTQSILEAETINLGDSIQAVRETEAEMLEVPPQAESVDIETLEIQPDDTGSKSAQGLDSILSSMTIGKKKDSGSTDEDPFEFLGSVDDF